MTIRYKTAEPATVGDDGSITAYASTWTREPDSYGDVVIKGAFAEAIAEIKSGARTLPMLWNHDYYDLKAYIGTVTEISEDDHGLLFTATFDDTSEAQHARELAKDGRICKLSFAYDILESADVKLDDGRTVHELRKLDIYEVSLVMYPANADTSVIEVKSAVDRLAKSGRRNSKSDEDTIRQAIDLLQSLLDDGDEELDDDAKSDDDAAKTKDDDTSDSDAGETDDPAKGGEGVATPEGREVDDRTRLEAYRAALLAGLSD